MGVSIEISVVVLWSKYNKTSNVKKITCTMDHDDQREASL